MTIEVQPPVTPAFLADVYTRRQGDKDDHDQSERELSQRFLANLRDRGGQVRYTKAINTTSKYAGATNFRISLKTLAIWICAPS